MLQNVNAFVFSSAERSCYISSRLPTLETDAFHGMSIPFLSWLTFLLFFCFQVTSGVLNKSAKEDQERSTHVHEELWLVCCSEECG